MQNLFPFMTNEIVHRSATINMGFIWLYLIIIRIILHHAAVKISVITFQVNNMKF
jgi:hypothetical protein